ncbi:MAG: hypothetical protein J6R87_01625, partial [Rikenellaceae bacterium]|nr:hypothetical protein [Rikenellaceae bacterium]
MTSAVVYALVLSLCAGMATGVGSLIAILTRSTNRRFISFALGLSAGVMLYVSMGRSFNCIGIFRRRLSCHVHAGCG